MKEQELNKTEYLVQYWNDNTGNGCVWYCKSKYFKSMKSAINFIKKHHKKNVKAPSGEIYQYNLGADENYHRAYAYYYSGDTKKFSKMDFLNHSDKSNIVKEEFLLKEAS